MAVVSEAGMRLDVCLRMTCDTLKSLCFVDCHKCHMCHMLCIYTYVQIIVHWGLYEMTYVTRDLRDSVTTGKEKS